jgi:hypothetical protein
MAFSISAFESSPGSFLIPFNIPKSQSYILSGEWSWWKSRERWCFLNFDTTVDSFRHIELSRGIEKSIVASDDISAVPFSNWGQCNSLNITG